MRRYKEGISALVFQTLFCEETSGGVAKCRRLFSQAFTGTFSGPKKNPVISFFVFCSTTPLLYHTDLRSEAHNHVTLVVPSRDSWFALISIYQAASEMFYLLLSTPSVTSQEG